jgi:sec-independent protein translocase protein TatA
LVTSLALFGPIGTWEALVLLALGLLIFGKRLPEVGKSLGKGIVEFRKGLAGIEDEIEQATRRPSQPRQEQLPEREPQVRTPVSDAGEDVRVSRGGRVEGAGGTTV